MTAGPPRRLRVVLAIVATLSMSLTACGGHRREQPRAAPLASAEASPGPRGPVTARVEDLLGDHARFGVTMRDNSASAVARVAATVGCRPSLLQVFASVEKGVSAQTLRGVSGLPVLSIEPWRTGRGPKQPEWSLSATIKGRWDRQYAALARAVVEFGDPILIRFAHEMNGRWYPWGVANGNRPGEFVEAWRHVVDLFRRAGATNVLWVWSPNILRGASSRTLKEFWPGNEYVDVVGLTGYGVRERSPGVTYGATLKLVHALTDKRVLLTEMGAQAGPDKRAWLKAIGPWLHDNPGISGFLWNQIVRDGDWRYDDTPDNLAAFKSGLSSVALRC